MSREYREYATSLEAKLNQLFEIAEKAREKHLDPVARPEIDIAKDLAGLVEGLVGPPGVAESIRELSESLPREELAFKIAEEIVYGKFGHLQAQAAAEQAVRTALAILTEGITAAPLQGVARVAIKENPDKSKYLAVYFAGPIRSAGGTDQALTLVVADFVRRLLGLERYKPLPEEIARFTEELRLYERSIGRFQYKVSDDELKNALELLPVEVTGIESDRFEVSSFRNLPRIETNCVRGGALRVVNDGIVGRSTKAWTVIEKLGIEGWDWLKRVRQIQEKRSVGFMEDVIAGRPVFSFPSSHGGFRLRYGRARNTGLAAMGIHPATMLVLQRFLAAGTQLRIEAPGKAGVVLPVDGIETPIVRLKDDSVVRVSLENFESLKDQIDRVLFVGDILVSFGDFLYNNKPLYPSGITEEWWAQELRAAIQRHFNGNLELASSKLQLSSSRLSGLMNDGFSDHISGHEALMLTSILRVPLYPRYTYFWKSLNQEDFGRLRVWLRNSEVRVEGDVVQEVAGAKEDAVKKLLEKLCIPHRVNGDKIVVAGDDAEVFAACLAWNTEDLPLPESKDACQIIHEISGIIVREKAPTFLGARMGRPEKAKRREMRPLVHALFPIGLSGGSHRNLIVAMGKGSVSVDLVRRRCPVCREFTFRLTCPSCRVETVCEKYCPQCKRVVKDETCPACGRSARSFEKQLVDLRQLVNETCERLAVSQPELIKAVKGLMNETKTPETLEKGLLRARRDLSVYKDGTIRFDATNAPLTHFKPAEVGVAVEKLRQLGYAIDQHGEPLVKSDQICELKAQDVIISRRCAEYFVNVAAFVDELLEKVYGLQAYYDAKGTEDLIGHLVIGLAPHTSVGILGRVVGFTELSLCYTHPLWHSAKRRDCDGDEDALMLALDTILNFSKVFLPAQIGGIMDAPLFIIPTVNPLEVQRQAHEVDVASAYPLAFYEKTLEGASPHSVRGLIDMVDHRLGLESQFEGYGYTTPVSDINMGNKESMYKKLGRMIDKLNAQLSLAERIDAVDARRVAWKVLTTHFMRDIAGNLRAFSTQGFRCKGCNKKFRRTPLKGKCTECGGALTLTVYRGGIEKYLDAAEHLIRKYNLPQYYSQRLVMVREEIDSLFEGKKPKQVSLKDFVA
ncbi:MAG TPA: DNA polymerase II large subunit [Candidatus Bathyarchaeia archaeon]|nr:DNA polymerase II large subunit [Candidatus Bathyarchaeia archaeon]